MAAFADSKLPIYAYASRCLDMIDRLESRSISLPYNYTFGDDHQLMLPMLPYRLLTCNLRKIKFILNEPAAKEIENKDWMQWLMKLKDVLYEMDDLLDYFEYRSFMETNDDNGNIIGKITQTLPIPTFLSSPNINQWCDIIDNGQKIIDLFPLERKFTNLANLGKHFRGMGLSKLASTLVGEAKMDSLKQKYLLLPTSLQECFAYLSIYPINWRFKREEVIQMWMAQGMIYQNDEPRMAQAMVYQRIKDIGEDYFKTLISKSFFQQSGDDDHYTIHDQLYDLIESVSKDDCFRVESDEFKTIPTTTRHLFINKKHLARLKENASVLNNLRTLVLHCDSSVHPNVVEYYLQGVIIQLKSIRSLTLKNCHLKGCPYYLNNLIHLRYLDLSGNCEIKELPDGLTRLYHLQTLNLFQLEFDRIPATLNELINLQNLICSSRALSMVAEIGKMIRLKQLMCPFYVQNVPGFDITQLENLRKLGGCLCIRFLENVGSKGQARKAKLWEKENLVELVLHWGSAERKTNSEVENEVLEGLKPPSKVKKLHIDGYKGTRSPSWYAFLDLVSFKLTGCSHWEVLPALGEFRHLEDLELTGMHAIRTFDNVFHGSSFPSLRKLVIDDLRKWEMWSPYGNPLFPKLETLRISGCPKLKEIPQLPPTLKMLEVFNVGLKRFPQFLRVPRKLWSSGFFSSSLSPSLTILSIKGCPKMQFPDEWLINQHKSLRKLEELTIDPSGIIDSLLVKAINKYIVLKKLCIDSWPSEQNDDEEEERRMKRMTERMTENLRYEQDRSLLLESLKSLEIINCYVKGEMLSKSFLGLTALQSLKLDWCSGPTSLSFQEGLQKLTSLNRLEIINCRELTSLVDLEDLCSLVELKVIGCPELTLLPSSGSDETDVVEREEVGLPALSTLCIDNTLLLKVLLSKHGLASVKQLEIIFSDEAKIDEKVFHSLISLRSLRFEGCHNLVTLPPLKKLHSLEKLEIEDCSNFQSLPSKEDFPPSLVHLVVLECHPEFNKQYNMDDGPDWQTIRDIPSLSFD